MIATNPGRLRRPVLLVPFLLAIACTGCKPPDDRPPAPQTAEPAPPAAAPITEDRGRKQGDAPASAPDSDPGAFSNVDSGEAERAASKRGHDSAGEATATEPRSGQ